MDKLGFFIIFLILFVIGFLSYSFLSKVPKKGKTTIQIKIAIFKFLRIEFKSEHDENPTKKVT